MIYTHVLARPDVRIVSPLDRLSKDMSKVLDTSKELDAKTLQGSPETIVETGSSVAEATVAVVLTVEFPITDANYPLPSPIRRVSRLGDWLLRCLGLRQELRPRQGVVASPIAVRLKYSDRSKIGGISFVEKPKSG